MATYGNSTQPSGSSGSDAGGIYLERLPQAVSSGTVNTIHGWIQAYNASWAGLNFVVYSGTDLVPLTKLGESAEYTGDPSFVMADKSAAPASATTYSNGDWLWVGVQVEHDSTAVSLETSSGIKSFTYVGAAFGSAPSSLSGLGTVSNDTRRGFYLDVTAGASASLDTLSSPVNVGGTGYTGSTTGLGAATSLTFAGKAATITDTGANSFEWSMPTFAHGVTYPAMGVQTFTVGDGTLTATKTATVNSLSGYTPVTMATLDRGEWSIGKDTNIVTGDVIHLPTAGGTLNTDGTLTDYVFGSYTMWRRDVSDGKMYSSTLTVSESGVGGGGTTGLTSSKITSSGLTSSGLTTI